MYEHKKHNGEKQTNKQTDPWSQNWLFPTTIPHCQYPFHNLVGKVSYEYSNCFIIWIFLRAFTMVSMLQILRFVFLCSSWGSVYFTCRVEIFNFKPSRQHKEFSDFLCMWRCKSHGLLILFPWHVPHLCGACNPVFILRIHHRDWPQSNGCMMTVIFLLKFPQVSPAHVVDDVQSLSPVQLFTTPWTAACQTSLSFTVSWSWLKLMSIESMMPPNHLILCCPLLLLPSIFPRISVFSNESTFCIRWSKYWRFSISINSSNERSGLISFRIDWFHLLVVQGSSKSLPQNHSLKTLILWSSAFFMVQLSYPYMENWKNIALTRQTFVGK